MQKKKLHKTYFHFLPIWITHTIIGRWSVFFFKFLLQINRGAIDYFICIVKKKMKTNILWKKKTIDWFLQKIFKTSIPPPTHTPPLAPPKTDQALLGLPKNLEDKCPKKMNRTFQKINQDLSKNQEPRTFISLHTLSLSLSWGLKRAFYPLILPTKYPVAGNRTLPSIVWPR